MFRDAIDVSDREAHALPSKSFGNEIRAITGDVMTEVGQTPVNLMPIYVGGLEKLPEIGVGIANQIGDFRETFIDFLRWALSLHPS